MGILYLYPKQEATQQSTVYGMIYLHVFDNIVIPSGYYDNVYQYLHCYSFLKQVLGLKSSFSLLAVVKTLTNLSCQFICYIEIKICHNSAMGNNEFAINNHFDTDMLNMDPLASTERTRTPGGRGVVKNWQNFADVFYGPLVTFYNTHI